MDRLPLVVERRLGGSGREGQSQAAMAISGAPPLPSAQSFTRPRALRRARKSAPCWTGFLAGRPIPHIDVKRWSLWAVGMLSEVVRPVYASGECEIDVARRELRILGAPVPVGGRAFEIIQVLAQSAGELVTKDELMDRIWPGAVVLEKTLQVHAVAIRKALGRHRGLLKTEFRPRLSFARRLVHPASGCASASRRSHSGATAR